MPVNRAYPGYAQVNEYAMNEWLLSVYLQGRTLELLCNIKISCILYQNQFLYSRPLRGFRLQLQVYCKRLFLSNKRGAWTITLRTMSSIVLYAYFTSTWFILRRTSNQIIRAYICGLYFLKLIWKSNLTLSLRRMDVIPATKFCSIVWQWSTRWK